MKFTTKYIGVLFIILVFLGIFLYYLNQLTQHQELEEVQEGFGQQPEEGFGKDCPNLLINRGDAIVLYNTNATHAKDQGTTAGTHIVAVFKDLDEYANYVKQQRSAGKYCPVLYLRQETNTQGKDVYKMYTPPTSVPHGNNPAVSSSHQPPFYVEGGLPAFPTEPVHQRVGQVMDASRENGQFNKGDYPGFDPYGLYVGKITNLDDVHVSTQYSNKMCSYNPADPNWCGVIDTQKAVDSGVFAENEVTRAIYPKATVK